VANAKFGLYALAIKLGPKILGFGFKLLKGLKAGKGIMVAASLGAYSYLFTWQFAFLILFMVFVHESGHIWAMKKCGMRTKGIYFIPFLGAAAVTDEEFKTRNDEQFVAIMGPVWGLGLSLLAVVAYGVTANPFFAAVASWMAMINLFNLLPMNPLDGGRIVKSIAFSFHSHLGLVFMILGFVVSLYIAIVYQVGLFGFLVIVGGLELFFELFYRKQNIRKKREQAHAHIFRVVQEREPEFMEHIENIIKEEGLTGEDAEHMRQEARATVNPKQLNDLIEVHLNDVQILECPQMNLKQILSSATTYLGVAALLFAVMLYMNHVPGADAAMEILKDK